MNKYRTLNLLFHIDSTTELVLNDFIGLFECAEAFSRYILEQEAFNLSSDLGIPDDIKISTLYRIHKIGKKLPIPIEVIRIEKGSWYIEILVPGAVVLWILKKYIHPAVQEAWNESHLRDIIVNFLREKVFLGSKRNLEQKAVEQPSFKGLQIKSINEIEVNLQKTEIKVDLGKKKVLEVELTERELIEDFIRKLKA